MRLCWSSAEFLSWAAAAFTSLPGSAALATWTPRIGRAIGISVAVFVLLSFGWLLLAGIVILPALHWWINMRSGVPAVNLVWITLGLLAFSPLAAPIMTTQALDSPYADRWQFWAIMSFWCVLAWAAAGAMYWVALKSFDHHLGRMRETSQEYGAAESTLLSAGRQHAMPENEEKCGRWDRGKSTV